METREHDIFMDMTANPAMNLNELVATGVNANNTALEDKSVYEQNDWVRDKYKNEYGEFDQMKFDSAYQNAKIAYNMLSQADYNKAVDSVVSFHRDNIFVPADQGRSGPEYYEYFTSNPYKLTSSISELGKITPSSLSVDEMAQANKVLLNPTTAGDNFENAQWGGSPNDNFFKYFTNTLVLAQWEDEGDHPDPVTGIMQHHQKGDLKTDDEGNFYYEDLDGREVYGRQVLNKTNVLTTDGSFWNKFDPFDSDDIQQKSIAGSLIKNIALVGTMFLPGIGPWVAGISIATQVAGLLGTMAKMAGSIDPLWNELEGWSKSVNRQTAKTQYAQEHTWCWENFINLFGDVVGQLKEQRFIFEKVPMVFTGNKNMSTVVGQTAKLKEFEKAEEALINTKFGKLSSLPDPDKQLARIIEAQQRIHARAAYNLDSFVKGYNKLGEVISKGYMTAITVGDTYGQAKLQGASDMDATLLTLGYAVGEYAILNTGLGEWVLPELRVGKYKNQAIARALTNLRKDADTIHKAAANETKKSYIQKIFNMGKNIATAEYSTGVKSLKATLAAGAGEGFEEVSEEVLADFSKGCFNVVKWLQGDNTSLTTFGYNPKTGEWDSSDVFDRYGMSLIGGFAGGATTNAFTSYKTIKNYDKMTSREAIQEIVKMARNHELDRFRKDITKMKDLGDTTKSATNYEITDNGAVLFMPGTKENNQELYNKQAIIGFTNLIENILNANGAKSDSELLDALTLREMRFTTLHDSLTAGSYMSEYNDLNTKLVQIISDINSRQNAQKDTNKDGIFTDREERKARDKEEPTTDIALDTLYKQLNETKKKLDDLVNGKRSVDFLRESLFETTAALSAHFTFPTYILFAEHKFNKKYKDLTETQRKEAADEYAKWASTEKVDQIRSLAHIYYDIAQSASNAIKQTGKKYQQDPRAIYSFNDRVAQLFTIVRDADKVVHYLPNEVENDNYGELAQLVANNSKLAAIYNGLIALGNIDAINKIKELGESANAAIKRTQDQGNKELNEMKETHKTELEKLQKQINEKVQQFADELETITDENLRVNRKREQDTEIANLQEELQETSDNFTLEEEIKKQDYLESIDNLKNEYTYNIAVKFKESVKKLVESFKERGFINEEARNQFQQALTYYYNELQDAAFNYGGSELETKYQDVSDEIRTLQQTILNLATTSAENALNEFSITMNQENLNYTKLLQKLNAVFNKNMDDVSQFMVNSLSEELKNAIFIAQMYRAAIVGASTDNASLNNIFGYNATINDVLKAQGENPILAEIDSRTANLIVSDIDGVLNKLVYFKNLLDFNNGQTLNAHDQSGLRFAQLVYKKLKYIVQVPEDDPFRKWNGFNEFKAAIEAATIFESAETQEWVKVPSDQKKEFEHQKINIENAVYDFFQKNKDKLSDPSKLAELINNKHFQIYINNNTIITKNAQELDDNAFIWWLASRAALKSEDFYSEFAATLNENEDKIITPLAIQEVDVYNCYAMILNGNVFKQFADAFNYSIENDLESTNFDDSTFNKIKNSKDSHKLLRTYFDALYIKYANIVLNEGIPGSGKTTGVSKLTIRMLRKYHLDLLKNVWITHCVSEENAKGFRDSLELKENESKVFSRESLLKKISPDWKEYTKNSSGAEIIPEGNITYDEGYIRNKLAISETSEPPSLIIIDEVTRMNKFDLDLIQQFAQKYSISVLVMGDYDQISSKVFYKFPTDAEKITNDQGQIIDSRTSVGNNHFFIRSPKLGISMRSDNLLITENNYQLIQYVQNSGEAILKWYQDDTGLYGHKLIDSSSNLERTIIPEIRKLISTLKENEKIGFIYNSNKLRIYNALQNDPSLKDHIEFLPDGSAQGSEAQYYIIDGSELDLNSDKKLIYTGLTRSSQGCLFIGNEDVNTKFKFRKVSEKLYYPNTQPALKKYLINRKGILQEICHGNPTRYIERTKQEQQPLANIQQNPQQQLRQEFISKLENARTYRELQEVLNNPDYAPFISELNKEGLVLKTLDVINEDDSVIGDEYNNIVTGLLQNYFTNEYLINTSTYNPYIPLFNRDSRFEGEETTEVKLVKELLAKKRIHQNYIVQSDGSVVLLYRITPTMYIPIRNNNGEWKPLIGYDENVNPIEFDDPPTEVRSVVNWLNSNLQHCTEEIVSDTLTKDSETGINTLLHDNPIVDQDTSDIFVANIKGSIQTLNTNLADIKVNTQSTEGAYLDVPFILQDTPLFQTSNDSAVRNDSNNNVLIINHDSLIEENKREFIRQAIKKIWGNDKTIIYDDEITDYYSGQFVPNYDEFIPDDVFIELANTTYPEELYTDKDIKDWSNKRNQTKLPLGRYGLHTSDEWLKGAISITMPLYSFNTFELGVEEGPNDTIVPSAFAAKRIDSINGLLRIDKLYGTKLAPSMSEAIKVIADLRDAVFNRADKTELLGRIKDILGIDEGLYATFAFKSSAWDKQTGGFQSTDPNAFEKGAEHSIYNGNKNGRSGEINHKSLVIIIGSNTHGNLIELPLLTLSNPFSLLAQDLASVDLTKGEIPKWKDLAIAYGRLAPKYRQFNIQSSNYQDADVRGLAQELINQFENDQQYKCMINLLKLWLFTDNGIFHILDSNFTIAKDFALQGQQFISEITVEQWVKGFEFSGDNWITLEEFNKNEERYMSPVMVSYDGLINGDSNCRVQKGHPFVLVSQDSRIKSTEDLISQYMKQLTDPSIRPVVSIMYILPPKATISEYIKNLDRIFRKKKTDILQLGDLTTVYKWMDILLNDNYFSTNLKQRIGNETYDRLAYKMSELKGLSREELIEALQQPSNVREGKEENVAHMLNGMLMRVAMNKALLTSQTTFNEEGITKITEALAEEGIDGVYYNVKPSSANDILGLKIFPTDDKYQINGRPFQINGKLDSYVFTADLDVLINQIVRIIRPSNDGKHQYIPGSHLYYDTNTGQIGNSSIENLTRTQRTNNGKSIDSSIADDLKRKLESFGDPELISIFNNIFYVDGNIIETSLLNNAKSNLIQSLNQKGYIALFDSNNRLLIGKFDDGPIDVRRGNTRPINLKATTTGKNKINVKVGENVYEVTVDVNARTLTYTKMENSIPPIQLEESDLSAFANSKATFAEKVGYDEDLMKVFEATSLSDLIQRLEELAPILDFNDATKSSRNQDLLDEFGENLTDEQKRVFEIITKYEDYNMNKENQCPVQITINL